MEIKNVTVKYGLTYNLGDYNNVRPEVVLSAELAANEDPAAALTLLEDRARARVEAMVDEALERLDEAPFFYDGPRYTLYTMDTDKLAVIAPAGDPALAAWHEKVRNRRCAVVSAALASDKYAGYRRFDCSSGDLSRLPLLESFKRIVNADYDRNATTFALIMADADIPDGWRSSSWHLSNRLRENVIIQIATEAQEKGVAFIDATGGDFTKLPPPVSRPPEPARIDEDEFDDEDDEDEFDDEDDYEVEF